MCNPNMRTPDSMCYQCPLCGNALRHDPSPPRFDAPCSRCGYHLWCRSRLPSLYVHLEVLPQRIPQPEEVEQLVESLVMRRAHTFVVVDLSCLDIVDSAFVARLVAMQKLIRASGGRLAVQGLCPTLRQIFACLRLDRVLGIVDPGEQAAAPKTEERCQIPVGDGPMGGS